MVMSSHLPHANNSDVDYEAALAIMDRYSAALQRRQSRECGQRLLALDRARALDPRLEVSSQVRLEPSGSICYLPKHEVVVYFGCGGDIVPYVLYTEYD